MSFFREKPSPSGGGSKQPNAPPEKQQLNAQNFQEGLELLDAKLDESELLRVVAPIRIICTGGFLAVSYLKSRVSTVDLDYCLDPELYDNEDVKEDIRIAAESVAIQLTYPDDWFNDEMTIFTKRSTRPKLFQESLDQGVVLWQGKRLIIYAIKFEWALETKLRRLSYASAPRNYSIDMSDAVAILNVLVERNGGQPLDREFIRGLNWNGFDVLPTEGTLDAIARTYQQTYNKDGLNRE
ncbi:hypothetical protein VE01_05916 [Pseudogymnoascus verrucosus]|uniref:DUF7582 domain-containing protein n=1 Tax=Pseudogymnoascus verrucosus TaxID=342668 RepID=A0A1B8GID8_9PEZI|nr:uncharacterized protein VE01_05916 [Pseudogymnoascus verrucosus]OBT95623.1 hypothetical protein VE01_05916 [Pseudogymnoascus verrucosus]